MDHINNDKKLLSYLRFKLMKNRLLIIFIIIITIIMYLRNFIFGKSFFIRNQNFKKKNKLQYLALCLIVKDVYDDINEWIEYHYRKGVSKFYIIDHSSKYPLNDNIMQYIRNDTVSYYYLNRSLSAIPNPQQFAYEICIHNFSSRHTFMGFIDYDEFIITANDSLTIPDVLQKYERFGGLSLNWLVYGHSNYTLRPEGGVRNYNTCERNKHIKTIVNTMAKPRVRGDPHNFDYNSTLYTVDTNKNKVLGPFNDPIDSLYDIMYINHYLYKSKEEFERKSLRGSADGGGRTKDFWDTGNFSSRCKSLTFPRAMNIQVIDNNDSYDYLNKIY